MKYICDPHVVPTNTCPADFAELAKCSAQLGAFSPTIQLDISDGVFSPVLSWPYRHGQMDELSRLGTSGELLPEAGRVQYEIHMMVKDPTTVGGAFARAGAFRLLPHIEAFESVEAARTTLTEWRQAGVHEVGLALLIDTPLEALDPLIDCCDVVQLMSIGKIGAQGQPFDEHALQRIEELHAKYPDLLVAVDGGISEANIELLVRAGANRLCVGSAIARSSDPARAFARIHERAMLGCTPSTAVAVT